MVENSEERVKILKDARAQIVAGEMIVKTGWGFLEMSAPIDFAGHPICEVVSKEPCYGCQQGALYLAQVCKGTLPAPVLDEEAEILIDDFEVRTANEAVFGDDAAYAECAFEETSGYGLFYEYELSLAASRFGSQYSGRDRSTERSLAIIDRMIERGGVFFTDQEVADIKSELE